MLVQIKTWIAHYQEDGVSLCRQAPRQKPENYELLMVQIPVAEPYLGYVITTNRLVHVCDTCRAIVEVAAYEAAEKAR